MAKVITWCLTIVLLLSCTSCTRDLSGHTTQAEGYTACAYDIKETTDDHSYSASQITYPKIVGSSANFEAVNLLIRQAIDLQVEEMLAEDSSNTAIELDYSISLQSKDLICVLFEGILSRRESAHPSYIAFSVCVSLTEAQIVDPLTLVELDEEFFRVLREQLIINQNQDRFNYEQWKTVAAYINTYSNTDIADIICTNPSKTLALRTDGVIVLFPVPYALGDYVKIPISYS